MTLFRIYATAGRTDLICTAYVDTDDPGAAMELVRENRWVASRMTDDAWAEETEEVLEGCTLSD